MVVDQRIVTPAVAAAAAEQFDCASATGVPLEDDGSTGTAGVHWEAATLAGEMMIGSSGGAVRAVLSEITLALADDSGWYSSNRASAGFLRHGHLSGCELLDVRIHSSD